MEGRVPLASPYVFFARLALVAALPGTWQPTVRPLRWRLVVGTLVVLLCLHLALLDKRALRFATSYTGVSMQRVTDDYQRSFARYQAILRVPQPSLLAIDLGGVLWTAAMRVHDLGTLCVRVIARTLRADRPAFHDYVFATIRPTFIAIHGQCAVLAAFAADPRFRRDYMAIVESPNAVPEHGGVKVFDGRYVRRDALRTEADLARLRE